MKLPPFEYHLAESVDEAVALLAELGDEAKVLAGGQSLIPLLSLRLARPAHLVDVNAVDELAHIRDGSTLEIGATVRHRQAERSPLVRSEAPLVAAALGFVGHTAIRTRGTIGGSMAHADPAAELPAVLAALDGEVVARSVRGTRTIGADRFVQGFLTTALEPDELVTGIRIDRRAARTGWAFHEFSRRSGDFAIVGAAAVIGLGEDGRISHAALALSGAGSTPVRAEAAERLLVGESPSAELWASAGAATGAALDPPTDVHGTAAYRRHLAGVLARRALQEASDRARGTR